MELVSVRDGRNERKSKQEAKFWREAVRIPEDGKIEDGDNIVREGNASEDETLTIV